MRRSKTFSPAVDPVEPRVLLSNIPPVLTPPEFRGIVREARLIVGELAQTGQVRRASAELTRLSAQVPGGPEILAPQWRADLALYRPHARRSAAAVRVLILDDLYGYVRVGPAPRGPLPPPLPYPPLPGPTAPFVSRDSATVFNETGYALRITVRLNGPGGPFLTKTLPSNYGSSALFDFHSATGGFLSISIIRADGIPTPPPLSTGLDMPMNGYYGTPFTVSLTGSSFFNLTPP